VRSLPAPALFLVLLMFLPACAPVLADPVPVTIAFSENWTGAEHYLRDPTMVEYRGKVYCFFESDDPSGAWPGYHGNLYYRTYEETAGIVSLSDVISLTPSSSPFAGEHRNEKATPIVYKDKLYLFWHSSDKTQVPNGDVGWVEILVKSYDGRSWGPNTMLNAPIEPYNMLQRGCNQFPSPFVYNGRLYVIWERNVQHTENGVNLFYSDIWLRSFDGETWDRPVKVSEETRTDYNQGPGLGVHDGKLCMVWENISVRDPNNWKWELKYRTFDGTSFSPIGIITTSSTPGLKDSWPRLLDYDNPVTHDRELYVFWRVMAVPEGESLIRAGVSYCVLEDKIWSEPHSAATLMKAGRASTLGKMSLTIFDSRIYLAYATTDDAQKTGEDFDIAYRTFDGAYWSPVGEATDSADETVSTRPGETKPKEMDPSGLPIGFSPLEDWRPERMRLDNAPQLQEYRHRLYMSWRMIPDFNFYGKDIIYLRIIVDADADGDGVMDTQDSFPQIPSDWTDTDGDGTGDNTDPAPYNPDIWLEGQKKGTPQPPSPAMGAAVLLVVCAGAAFALRPSGKGDDK